MDQPLVSDGTVRRLWAGEAELYRQHLLRLDAGSRRNRFCGVVSDDFIRRYAEPSALRSAFIYGFFVDGVLRGAAELRLLEPAGEAEAEVSVENVERLHMLCLAENRRMQQLARKFDAELSFQSGSVTGEMKAPHPTPMSVIRELMADGTDLATAMLDVPSQLAKRLENMNGPPERRRRDRRYERLMPVDNWR